MSNITNLIGTTWRLGDKSFEGVIGGENTIFLIDASGVIDITTSDGETEHAELSSFNFTCPSNSTVAFTWRDSDDIEHEVQLGGYSIGDTHINAVYEFTITGGADISNPLFIDFINTYGTLVSGGEEKPIFTYDLTQLNLAAGTYSITIVAKAVGYNDAPSNTAQFVVEQESFVEETNEYGTTMVINRYTEEPNEYGTTMIIGGETTTNLISFTIEGTTHQAEEGMTYAQWVDSKYNTGNYYTNGTFLYNSGGQAVGTSPNMAVSNVIEQGDVLNTFTGGAA